MDALAALLAAQRADGAFVIRSDLCAPWSIRVEDRAPLTAVTVLSGVAVLRPDGGRPTTLATGDAALVRGTRPYAVASDETVAPQASIGPGQHCTRPDGSPLSDFRRLGAVRWGNVADGASPETVLLTGTYVRTTPACARLLARLPEVLVVARSEADDDLGAVSTLLDRELGRDEAAQDVVVDRLVDLLTIALLRAWLARHPDAAPAWFTAHDHPVVGPALRRLHHEPARPWTLATLAHDVGVSRATLARHFTRELGEPPMGYLARCRVDLAADLLATTDRTVEAVARQVGYGGGFALSVAFRRHLGRTPTAYRDAVRRR